MPEDKKKQSTVVTFQDPENTGRPVKMHGVSFLPGKAVDLADFMPQEKAEAKAAALSTNRFFNVQGTEKAETFDAAEADRLRSENNQEAAQAIQEAEQRNAQARAEAERSYQPPGLAKLEAAPARGRGKAKGE